MKLRVEYEKIMQDKSADYIDWEELRYGNKEKSGIMESNAFCEGFKYAVEILSLKGIIKSNVNAD